MRRPISFLLACCLLLPVAALGDVVVVINPKSGVDRLTREEVVNVFLGRFRQLSSGIAAKPADLPPNSAEKAAFHRLLVNKELPEINAYWARLVFSGRTLPPKTANGSDELLAWVASTAGAVGYVDRSKVDGRVRVAYEFGN